MVRFLKSHISVKFDRYFVYGVEESCNSNGCAVEALVAVDGYVVPPKEAQRNKVGG